MKVKVKIKRGNVIKGRNELSRAIHELDGEYLVEFHSLNEPKSIEDFSRLYFYIRDLIWETADTGYTKKELHEEIKKRILPQLPKESWEGPPTLTTKTLNIFGWGKFIKTLKEFAQDFWEIPIN